MLRADSSLDRYTTIKSSISLKLYTIYLIYLRSILLFSFQTEAAIKFIESWKYTKKQLNIFANSFLIMPISTSAAAAVGNFY